MLSEVNESSDRSAYTDCCPTEGVANEQETKMINYTLGVSNEV